MKLILRMVIFFMSLLFLPDPILALPIEAERAGAVETGQGAVLSTVLSTVLSIAGSGLFTQVKPMQPGVAQVNGVQPSMLIAQAASSLSSKNKLTSKELAAQKSKSGRRVKKKKDFFSSKKPLPSVEMPTDWSGKIYSAPKRATKPKKSPRKKVLVKKTLSKTLRSRSISALGVPVRIPLPWLKGKHYEKRKLPLKNQAGKADDLSSETGNVQKAAIVVPAPVTEWSSGEIKSAQSRCKVIMRKVDATVTPIKPIRLGACGTPAPLKVVAFGEINKLKISISPPATLNCAYTARLAKWARDKLQPLALKYFNSPVSMVHNIASYSCRHRYNDKTRKISEHAKANALDIAGFTLKDGTSVSVLKHWDDEGEMGAFLKAVHKSACNSFVVVLGPEANAAHKNHFHFDVGRYKVCQ